MVTGDISMDNGNAVSHNPDVQVGVGMSRGRDKEERSGNTTRWLLGPFLGAHKGLHNVISSRLFFSFNQNEKCRVYVRNHCKFQISEVPWTSERCWRENWWTGCFLAVRASRLID